MATSPDGVRRPASSDPVVDLLATLAGCTPEVTELAESDSARFTPSQWTTILAAVRHATQANPTAPVILTHGTDTLAWTAGMLAVAGEWPVPIVLTAANRPLADRHSDAPSSLAAALSVARSAPPGVYVAFAGTATTRASVFQGGFVRKAHPAGEAFVGLPAPIGTTITTHFLRDREDQEVALRLESNRFPSRPLVLTCHPAFDPEPFRRLALHLRPDSLVLQLYPTATVPDAVITLAQEWVEAGIPVLACPPEPLSARPIHYPSTSEFAATGAQLHLDATLELLVPYACALEPRL